MTDAHDESPIWCGGRFHRRTQRGTAKLRKCLTEARNDNTCRGRRTTNMRHRSDYTSSPCPPPVTTARNRFPAMWRDA
jgi:hypothetical protein